MAAYYLSERRMSKIRDRKRSDDTVNKLSQFKIRTPQRQSGIFD